MLRILRRWWVAIVLALILAGAYEWGSRDPGREPQDDSCNLRADVTAQLDPELREMMEELSRTW